MTTRTEHHLVDAEAEPQARPPRDGELDGNETAVKTISRLVEQAGRAAGHLALEETQLAAVRHGPQLRAALDVAVTLGIVLAFLTAFAFVNWAAVSALAGPLPSWAAPLLLSAAWVVIGISLLVFALNRGDELAIWRRIRKLGADLEQTISARQQVRDQAAQRMRESLERLAEGLGEQAGVLVSSAVVPVASGVITAGERIIDGIDEITDDLGKAVLGGRAINWVADMALVPGRHFVSAALTALNGSARAEASSQPSSTRTWSRNVPGPDRRRAG